MTDSARTWIMCCLSTCIGAGIVFATRRQPAPSTVQKLNISQADIVPESRFNQSYLNKYPLLIEFLDYQCPPCRSLDDALVEYLASSPDLRRIVRHFPLSMHKYSMEAAILAEESSLQGDFDQVHKRLMHSSLNPAALKKIALEENIKTNKKHEAKIRVEKDIADAKRIGITGTPTLVLYLSPGKIYRVNSISDIRKLIQ
jgi:predicted DsbA family dithiol-disulfide isomerase